MSSISEIIHSHWERLTREQGLDPNKLPPQDLNTPETPLPQTCGQPSIQGRMEMMIQSLKEQSAQQEN